MREFERVRVKSRRGKGENLKKIERVGEKTRRKG